MAVNLKTLVGLKPKIGAYIPIVECVVNSINSIIESGIKNGEVIIKVITTPTQPTIIGDDSGLGKVRGFEIIDNGIGFTDEKTDAFDEPFTDNNSSRGGIGYGRITTLKIFDKVKIDSVFISSEGDKKRRMIEFRITDVCAKNRSIIAKEDLESVENLDVRTSVKLINMKASYYDKYDSGLETIAKRILEYLMPYFIGKIDDFPILKIQKGDEEIVLNDYYTSNDHFWNIDIDEKVFYLGAEDNQVEFNITLMGFYGSQRASSDLLFTAHNRTVSRVPLTKYYPEFKEPLTQKKTGGREISYYVKAYVASQFLDDNVNFQRETFNISQKPEALFGNVSMDEIEAKAVKIVKKKYQQEYDSRVELKKQKIEDMVNIEMPYFKGVLKHLDIKEAPYSFNQQELATYLFKKKYEAEEEVRKAYDEVFLDTRISESVQMPDEVSKLMEKINDLNRDDLVHYMLTRKYSLDVLDKLLKYDFDEEKFSLEDQLHDLIFPRYNDSEDIPYSNHNLWLLDEKLVFSKYVVSEKSIFDGSQKRVDLAVFGNDTMFREGDDGSSPVFIYEFKRPGGQLENKDHVGQLVDYLIRVRKGEVNEDLYRRPIVINPGTTMHGYLIVDLNEKIVSQAESRDFVKTADGLGYYKRSKSADCYIEILSRDKVVKDAQKRHAVFFNKLGLS